ncbi:group I truncated hemoglobin [Photobacterium alginatilyticum]|uniref:Group 1 truncated hemoglobin n=1 Tax=Photobacterium alginatilyticum TaxID=1775171 RepID=A0ABW9YGA1_9GAMM|nr:group 1 truncated hemoglobin [Photobacterium alginatilyticum]NBI52822.1 group 1 truncated hemoglobin [Photobacterium alginatilyticum]
MLSQRLTYFLKTLLLTLPLLGIGFAYADSHSQDTKSLYTRLGGLQPISVVVSDFIDVIVVDDTLNANPAIDAARKVVPAPYLKYQVTAMVCNATGGSCKYQGRSMKDAHAHLNISENDWQQMEVLLKGVLDKHGVPEKEQQELMEIVGSTKADIVTAP